MKLVKVSELKGNEKLAKHILTESGAELMAKGSIIKIDYIDKLIQLGIEYVFIDDSVFFDIDFTNENKGFIKEGFDADLVVVDLNKEGVFDMDNFYTKAEYSPFDGLPYKGKATMTIVNGEVIMEDDVII